MYHPFSVPETIKTSWDIFRKNVVTIMVYSTIAVFIIFLVGSFYQFADPQDDFTLAFVTAVIIMLIQGYTTLGLYKLIFTLIDSEFYEFEFTQIIPKIRMVLSYLSISIMFAIIVTTFKMFVLDGLLAKYPLATNIVETIELFVILYFALRCMFCICFIVDDDSGPIESLQQSFFVTKNNILKILLLLAITLLLIALPIIIANFFKLSIFGVGLILTYPFVNIILIVAYRKLVYSHLDIDDDVSETV
ncbi:hypothetical protein [Mucilaginibacter sp. KACC 22063]|uniref:hypothetical protein n=1 Tax=Mucilaginibacter sp. KACC 22063 TaxID=3025666 RepID=UPI0023654A21|nr:hypothetical protein [Mucilaginibacter sp. KACC 22063]WDF57096.1 hypothetical protein PQ461_08520 [Mucilaginibacter sp. KACC 22063]